MTGRRGRSRLSRSSPALRACAPAFALSACLLVFFLGKAFTIDDTVFLLQAEQVLRDPLHPTAFEIVWSEMSVPLRMSQTMATGPVMAYLLVPAVLAGGEEWIAHLVQLFFLALALYEVAALALRLGLEQRDAARTALLLASMPAVLAMAGTAMPDVPAMAFGLLGIGRLLAWKQEGRARDAILAFAGLATAPLARSHLLLVLGLAPFILFGNEEARPATRPRRFLLWLPVVAAPLLTLAVIHATRDPAGAAFDHAKVAGLFSSSRYVAANLFAFGTHWTLVLPLAIPWAILRGRSFWRQPLPYAAIALAGGSLLSLQQTNWLWLAPVSGLGLAAPTDILVDATRRRDRVQVLLGLWLLLALPILAYIHLPSKYLLASAPAAALLVARGLSRQRPSRARMIVGGVVLAGMLLGGLILRADQAFAGLGRRAGAELITPLVAAGERVWFAGHWGFHWYARRAGARCLTTSPPLPARGDIAVSSLVSAGWVIGAFPARRRLAVFTDATPGGRVMNARDGAGFYSNWWGYLPWTWGTGEIDRFEVWRFE